MRSTLYILIACAALLCGCATTPTHSTSGLDGAVSNTAGLSAYLDAAGKNVTSAVPNANPVGQALLGQALSNLTSANGKGTELQSNLALAKTQHDQDIENAKKDKESAVAEQVRKDAIDKKNAVEEATRLATEKANTEAHSALQASLNWFIGIGVLAMVGGLALKEFATTTLSKSVTTIGFELSSISLTVSVLVRVIDQITPAIVTFVRIGVIGGLTLLAIGGIYELIKNRTAIKEFFEDSLGFKQPAAPFTPATTAVLTAAIGAVAANPATATVSKPAIPTIVTVGNTSSGTEGVALTTLGGVKGFANAT